MLWFFLKLFGVPKVKKNISLPLTKFLNPPLKRERMHTSEKDRVNSFDYESSQNLAQQQQWLYFALDFSFQHCY